jgi:hypothetical protein
VVITPCPGTPGSAINTPVTNSSNPSNRSRDRLDPVKRGQPGVRQSTGTEHTTR